MHTNKIKSFLVVAASIYATVAQIPPATQMEYIRPIYSGHGHRNLMEQAYQPPTSDQGWIDKGGVGGPLGQGFCRSWGCDCGPLGLRRL